MSVLRRRKADSEGFRGPLQMLIRSSVGRGAILDASK